MNALLGPKGSDSWGAMGWGNFSRALNSIKGSDFRHVTAAGGISAGLGIILGVLNFGVFSDVFSVLVLTPLKHKIRKMISPKLWNSWVFRWCVKTSWTSNIPGNPYAMDALSTIIAGPFPSLVDHNACCPCLSLPVVVVGKPPAVGRYWSIQVFLKEGEGAGREFWGL